LALGVLYSRPIWPGRPPGPGPLANSVDLIGNRMIAGTLHRIRKIAARGLAVCGLVALVACGGDEVIEYEDRSVEDLYNSAMDQLEQGNYTLSAQLFDEVDRQHPYSVWATKAQVMSAYAHYMNDDYDEAVISLDGFIELHPGNSDAPYAYYLKAICYYEQISDVGRDQKMTELAMAGLEEVIQRYPKSKYARDAGLKLDLTRDHLAGKEMSIGRFYLRQGEYLAAINRFRNVVENYQTTTHVPEALHRTVESYLALGVTDEAQMAAAVLGYNFPGSQWYQDSYVLLERRNLAPEEKDDSWLAGLWDWAF